MPALDATHDPARRSWVASAQAPGTDFPIQNLPHGVFSTAGGPPRGGVAIGEMILDLGAALEAGLFPEAVLPAAHAAAGPRLNPLLALGPEAWRALRQGVSALLDAAGPEAAAISARADRLLVPMAAARMHLPVAVGNFTDFMVSIDHTARLGALKDSANPLPPCFKYLPVAYNSRATSVRVSGEAVARPNGIAPGPDGTVRYGPCQALDYELELGAFIGPGNALGETIPIGEAGGHLFGLCLLNDWSARDIQRFEMAPLGPFLSKSLSTSISPWIVTMMALAPFAVPMPPRPAGDPAPLPHLWDPADQRGGAYDIALEALISAPGLDEPFRVTATNARHMYWSVAQMLAHHTSNGCNLMPGDILATGTQSGPRPEERACMAEITFIDGPLTLPNGATRPWLLDGDEVIFRGRASRDGFATIGFGECRATITPAPALPAAARRDAAMA